MPTDAENEAFFHVRVSTYDASLKELQEFVKDELLSFQEGRLEAKVENVVRALQIKKTQI